MSNTITTAAQKKVVTSTRTISPVPTVLPNPRSVTNSPILSSTFTVTSTLRAHHKPTQAFRSDLRAGTQRAIIAGERHAAKQAGLKRMQTEMMRWQPTSEVDVKWATKALIVEGCLFHTRRTRKNISSTPKKHVVATTTAGPQVVGSVRMTKLLVQDVDCLFHWFAKTCTPGDLIVTADKEARRQFSALNNWV